MTPDDMQLLFEGFFALVAASYVIGLGIGIIAKLFKSVF